MVYGAGALGPRRSFKLVLGAFMFLNILSGRKQIMSFGTLFICT